MKNNTVRIILTFLLSAALVICLAACGRSEQRSYEEIISELIDDYGYCGTRSDKDTDALLKELASVDSDSAEMWQEILDYWYYAENEMPVNIGCLPGNLPCSDTLCIAVLGFELNRDGTMQDELLERLSVALACAKQYPDAYVLCTGGGTAAENKAVTEAELMGRWLIENGIEEKRLIIENRSLSTVQNAEYSFRILRDSYPSVDSMAIVSSSYHIPWGSLLFEATFMREASESGSEAIHIVSNAACPIENSKYSDTLSFEAAGLRAIYKLR